MLVMVEDFYIPVRLLEENKKGLFYVVEFI